MADMQDLTRDELIARLVVIYRWESAYQDFDRFSSEVQALNALLLTGGAA